MDPISVGAPNMAVDVALPMYTTAFEEYFVTNNLDKLRIIESEGLPWSAYLGVLGMPGKSQLRANVLI